MFKGIFSSALGRLSMVCALFASFATGAMADTRVTSVQGRYSTEVQREQCRYFDFSRGGEHVTVIAHAAFTLNNMGSVFKKEPFLVGFAGMRDLDDKAKAKTLPSFAVGALVDFPLVHSLHLETGLTYALKGQRVKGEVSEDGVKITEVDKYRFGYLEMPILLSFRCFVGGCNKFVKFDFGPYYGVALTGRLKSKVDISGDKSGELTYKVNLYNGEYEMKGTGTVEADESGTGDGWGDDLRRFDLGFHLGLGFVYEHYYFGIETDLGALNLFSDWDIDSRYTMKNRTLAFTLGYRF